ncbi:anti-sigma factor family protein [Oceanobacillus senegalensis]|uniref:anti-sigma factor family protein n=1 Tax=Oceanobacillus senegalensis TaxID=1936063 RepID=UPI000A30ADB5|nr:anti-sigma factor [Oceanobacillus senegalensis]
MKSHLEIIELMHKYLDGDLQPEEETTLRTHLNACEECHNHFYELKRTIALVQSSETMQAPDSFTENVMKNLPVEKKQYKYKRWFRSHPVLTAAAIFFIFMLSGVFAQWNQDSELVVSKQENLIIRGDTVIVPENEAVEGDLVVQNGDLIVKGTIDGDVTIINGELLEDSIDGERLMASVGNINGEIQTVDQVFEWLWYQMKNVFQSVFLFE